MLSKIKQTLFRPLGGFVPASVKDFSAGSINHCGN